MIRSDAGQPPPANRPAPTPGQCVGAESHTNDALACHDLGLTERKAETVTNSWRQEHECGQVYYHNGYLSKGEYPLA
jgi:hypothetical protein